MQRLALHVTALASVLALGLLACGSESGAGSPSGGAGGGGAGQAGSTSGGSTNTAGSLTGGAGAATGGQSAGGGGASAGGGGASAGASSAGTSGSGGSGGGPIQVTGTPLVYVGGFGDFPLRTYELNKTTGALTQRGDDADGGGNPSYLAINPAGTYVYAANEQNGQGAGVTAFAIQADGTLKRLNHQQGSDNCDGSCGFTHVAVDPTGKLLFAASYDGGSVSVFPLNADGSLGSEKSKQDFGGSAYAHSTGFDPSGKFAFVPTKGIDKVQQLKIAADGSLSQNSPANVSSMGGAGPRHIALHPSGKLMLVMNETDSTMTSYALSAEGTLSSKSTASSLPQGYQGETYGQHVEVSPDGRFVYGSNVGHDSIAVFSLDASSGALGLIQNQPSGGAWPRDFDVDPNGEVLVVANRDSNTLSVLKIGADGKLSQLGTPTTVPNEPSAVVIHYQK